MERDETDRPMVAGKTLTVPEKRLTAAWIVAAASFILLYAQVLGRLVSDWATDDNYSHGFIVLPFAMYFAWERRQRLRAVALRPSWWGLCVTLGGLAMLVVGLLGAERFLTRVSLVVVLIGGLAFVRGWASVRVLAFPFAFLLLMIPIPAIVFNNIAFPLQLLASSAGETILSGLNIPVLREGNLIILANTTLEVAEACSGIRSLVSLLTLAIIYGYFADERRSVRAAIALAAVPIAILANAVRVAGTGAAAHYLGAEAARGFFHSFSGWLMFGVAFGLLFLAGHLVLRLVPPASFDNRRPVAAQ
jgi:exosortase